MAQLAIVCQIDAQNTLSDKELLVAPLPGLLVDAGGKPITSPQQWEETRRGEVLELFREHVYGRVPESGVTVTSRIVFEDREALSGTAIQKEVELEAVSGTDTLEMRMLLFLPSNRPGPAPLFVGLNFNGNHTIHPDPRIAITRSWVQNNRELGITENLATESSRGSSASRWPVELILSRGYGVATIYYGDIDPDFDDGFKNGIQGLMDPEGEERPADAWGSIGAWAWGLSRAMDYFERDADIDPRRVAVIGHSRLGKTALWAGARDQRFALVISNDSGCGGAALSRRAAGERVSSINEVFPHWFARRFHDYGDNEGELPVDQHMLLALMAPRPLYVASAREDEWADPRGEYLSLCYGSEAWKLYGEKSMSSDFYPVVDEPVVAGKLGYHIRTGKHDLTRYDWEQFLNFADQQMLPVPGNGSQNPVTREWIEEHLFGTHPRLILTPGIEYKIWDLLDSGDTLISGGMELMHGSAESILELEPLTRILTGRRLLGVSREAIRRLSILAFVYRFERDQRYLDRLEKELEAVCTFGDWNPSHFLDVAEMAAGVALAVDWAGEWISPEVDRLARNALVNKALKPASEPSDINWWIETDNNWNLVCHGGLSLAAITVFEDEPELATAILHQAVEHIPLALQPYAPDGIYPEGCSYWFYATTYLTSAISAFESSLGTDFGFTRAPGIMESSVFSQVMAGPSGDYFDFFDSGLEGYHSLTHFGLLSWFAKRSGSGLDWSSLGRLIQEQGMDPDQVDGTRFFPVHFLNIAQMAGGEKEEFHWPESWSGGGNEPVGILRDSQNEMGSFFLAAKGGRAADNHGNMDAGSFVFELDGVRWSVDPGNQDYNDLEQVMGGELWNVAQDSRRWTLLTKSTDGHSVLTVNGEKHLVDARAPLVGRESRTAHPNYTFDLTALYGENLKKAERTFQRVSKTCLGISDRLEFSPQTESLTWQMITRASVEIKGDRLVLQQDGATLHIRMSSEAPANAKIVSLSPPPLEIDKDMAGLKRIELQWNREDFSGDGTTLTIELDSKK
jgi:hypothetical protein